MNCRRKLSKSSLKSSSASSTHSEELPKLYAEIDSLKQAVESLKNSVESRDAAIGTLAREKEKIYVELKGAQRTNRDLRRQMVDERDIHSKEKEHLMEEIQRLLNKEELEGSSMQHLSNKEQIIKSFQDQLLTKDEIICSICEKFMKLKAAKTLLRRRIWQLQTDTEEMYENIILILQENKMIMDNMLDKILRLSTVSRKSKKYMNLLKINVKLHYQNTQLKMSLLRSKRSAEASGSRPREDTNGDGNYSEAFLDRARSAVVSAEESACSPNQIKHKLKLRPPKLKYAKRHSPTDTSTFYKETKLYSGFLRETLTKSTSLPCLRLIHDD